MQNCIAVSENATIPPQNFSQKYIEVNFERCRHTYFNELLDILIFYHFNIFCFHTYVHASALLMCVVLYIYIRLFVSSSASLELAQERRNVYEINLHLRTNQTHNYSA